MNSSFEENFSENTQDATQKNTNSDQNNLSLFSEKFEPHPQQNDYGWSNGAHGWTGYHCV